MEKLDSDIQEIYEYHIDLKYVQDKLTELEDRSRRNNIRIDGIKETKGETRNDCEKKVLHRNWDWMVLKFAHRVKRNNRDSNTISNNYREIITISKNILKMQQIERTKYIYKQ